MKRRPGRHHLHTTALSVRANLFHSLIPLVSGHLVAVHSPLWSGLKTSKFCTERATVTFDDSPLNETDGTADLYSSFGEYPYLPHVYAYEDDIYNYTNNDYHLPSLDLKSWADGNYSFDTHYAHDNNGVIFVVPQTTSAWEPKDGDVYDTTTGAISRSGKYNVGTYIELEFCIYNICDFDDALYDLEAEEYDKSDNMYYHDSSQFYHGASNEVPLYGSIGNYKKILIPLNAKWEAGKKYTYNFKFGSTSNVAHSTDDPTGNAYDLIPIDLSSTVSYQDWNDASDEHTIREERHEDDSNNE